MVLHVLGLEGHRLLEELEAGGEILAHFSHHAQAHVGIGEVAVEFEGAVVVIAGLGQSVHALHALPHEGVGVGLGRIHENGLPVALQRLQIVLRHGQRRCLLKQGGAEFLVDDEGEFVGGDGLLEVTGALQGIAEVVPPRAAVGMGVHKILERAHRLEVAAHRFETEAELVQGRFVGGVLAKRLLQDLNGPFPESDVLVLEGDVDEEVAPERPVPEVQSLAVVVDGLLVAVRLGIQRGQREVDLVVGRLEGEQVAQPGNGGLDIAGTCHHLRLAELERQAFRVHLPGVLQDLAGLAVPPGLEVVLDERLQFHEVEKCGIIRRHHGLISVHDSCDFPRVLIVQFLVVHQLYESYSQLLGVGEIPVRRFEHREGNFPNLTNMAGTTR